MILKHCNNKATGAEESHSSGLQLHLSHSGLVHWITATEQATFNEIYSIVMKGKSSDLFHYIFMSS